MPASDGRHGHQTVARSLAGGDCRRADTFFFYLLAVYLVSLCWQSIALFIGASVIEYQRGRPRSDAMGCARPAH